MMANGAGVTAPAARNTAREVLPPAFTAVDERRFESEIKRVDAILADESKNREKFETRIEKAVNDLRGDMNTRFDKFEKSVDSRFDKFEKNVDARFDKFEKSVDVRFEKVDSDIKVLRGDMNARFEKVDARFEKMESYFRWMMGLLVGSILIPIALQYFAR